MIEKFIKERMEDYDCPDLLKEGMLSELLRDGRKQRGIFLFAVYELLKGKNNTSSIKKLVPVAAAIEYLYAGLFVHDHLPCMYTYDKTKLHQPCYQKYGKANAVLIGDALITEGFAILSDLAKPKSAIYCIRVLADAFSSRGAIAGYAVETSSICKKIKENVLKYIHTKKSANIFQAIVNIACHFYGEVSQDVSFDLREYALNFAVAKEILRETVLFVEIKEGRTQVKKIVDKLTYPEVEGLDKSIKAIRKLLKTAQGVVEGFENNVVLLELLSMIRHEIP